MKIEFLCSGSAHECQRCARFYQTVAGVISDLKLNGAVQLREVNDVDYFLEKEAYLTPSLIIDGELVSRGRFLGSEQIRRMIVERL